MIKQILVGLIVVGLGGTAIYYANNMVELFGPIPRAEKNLSGTKNAYVLAGFMAMVVGFLILLGVLPLTSPMNASM